MVVHSIKTETMPKKGTPQYEVWKEKFQTKRNSVEVATLYDSATRFFSSLKKKVTDRIIAEPDLLILLCLANVEASTLSPASVVQAKDILSLGDSDIAYLQGFFRSLDRDQLRLRLIGVFNFLKVNASPDSYPEQFKERYKKANFKSKYGYSLITLTRVKAYADFSFNSSKRGGV